MGFLKETKPIKVVAVTCDDAVDMSETPVADYIDTRDESLVKALPGKELTWFTIAPIEGDILAYVETEREPVNLYKAFMYGCIGCSNPKLLEWHDERGIRMVKPDAIKRLGPDLWKELGHVALVLGNLSSGEGRRFGLPRGLVAIQRRRSATTAVSAVE